VLAIEQVDVQRVLPVDPQLRDAQRLVILAAGCGRRVHFDGQVRRRIARQVDPLLAQDPLAAFDVEALVRFHACLAETLQRDWIETLPVSSRVPQQRLHQIGKCMGLVAMFL